MSQQAADHIEPLHDKLAKISATSTFEDKCIGTLLGAMIGDTLGAPLEFKTQQAIIEKQKQQQQRQQQQTNVDKQQQCHYVKDFINKKSWQSDDLEQYYYTDDTEMLIALATSLVNERKCSAELITQSYVKFYSTGRQRLCKEY